MMEKGGKEWKKTSGCEKPAYIPLSVVLKQGSHAGQVIAERV